MNQTVLRVKTASGLEASKGKAGLERCVTLSEFRVGEGVVGGKDSLRVGENGCALCRKGSNRKFQ